MAKPIFTYTETDRAIDILDAASCITRFLAEVAPAIHSERPGIELTEKGSQGLFLILDTLENTIEAAAKKL